MKELKKELLDQISFELDTFIIDMIEDKSEVGADELVEILEDLAKIQVSEIGKEIEEEEVEEELEEVLEEKDEEK